MSSQPVNYIHHQQAFISHIRNDDRLHSNDISLYFILFYVWNRSYFKNPFQVNRDEMMTLSHIGSKDTYMNCIKRLHACGYIIYTKGQRQYEQSWIEIVLIEEVKAAPKEPRPDYGTQKSTKWTGQIKSGTEACTTNETALCPEIVPQPDPKSGHFNKQLKEDVNYSQTSTQIDDTHTNLPPPGFKIPSILEVVSFFKAENCDDAEALLFFAHYQAVGWMAGGPVRNWQAVAKKWIDNKDLYDYRYQSGYKKKKQNHWYNDNADRKKNYDEPL